MKHYLFTTYFQGSERGNTLAARRQKEYEYCLLRNMNAGFDEIFLFVEPKDYEAALKFNFYKNISVVKFEERPTFQDFFHFLNYDQFSESINVISNADIFFDNMIEVDRYYTERVSNKEEVCLALTRWDWSPTRGSSLFDRVDSQDVWIVYGNEIAGRLKADFPMGVAGCDNRLAHELKECGYVVLNPSKTIKSFHYHDTLLRTNNDEEGKPIRKIPPPYLLLPPTE